MDKNEAINNIKEQLKKLMSFSAVEPETPETKKPDEKKMEVLKSKDGIKISVEGELIVGSPVTGVDEAGNSVSIEDKSYDLENGKTIVVKGGLIESVAETPVSTEAPAVESPAVPVVETMEAPAVETETETETETNPIDARVSALEGQIAQILEILQGLGNSQEMAMSKIVELTDDLPATKSIQLGKTPVVNKGSIGSEVDEIKQLKELQKKFGKTNSYSSFNISK